MQYVYWRNYLSYQEKLGKVSVDMETKAKSKISKEHRRAGKVASDNSRILQLIAGYDAELLMR